MPTKSSTEKRQRQAEKRRMHNRVIKSTVRTQNRKFLEAVQKGDKSAAETEFKTFMKLMDTATRKGIYHDNTAARKKARLQKHLNSMEG